MAVLGQFVSDVKAEIPVELVLELYYAHPSEGHLVVVLPERRKGVKDYEGLPLDVVEVSGFSFGLKGAQIVGSEPFEGVLDTSNDPSISLQTTIQVPCV